MHSKPDSNQTMKRYSPARLHNGRNARVVLRVHSVIGAAISQPRRIGPATNMWASLRSQTDDQKREEASAETRRRDGARSRSR